MAPSYNVLQAHSLPQEFFANKALADKKGGLGRLLSPPLSHRASEAGASYGFCMQPQGLSRG
ncbi:MAG: hypothetical protein CMN82_01150 [Spongiibacter sp.]|nr:hypothetical protein [Spongiibacter sp.]